VPIIPDLPIGDYHADLSLSKSKLADLDEHGPLYYFHRHVAKTIPGRETDALRLGRVFDGMMDDENRERLRWAELLPEDAPRKPSDRKRFAKKQSPDTAERCKWWDDYLSRNHGREMVTADERHLLEGMASALRDNPHFAKLWPLCQRQVTIRRDLPEFGLSLQSRPDGLCLGHNFAVDVKSIDSIDSIPRQTIKYAYAMQAAIGQWLLAQEGHVVEWYLAFVEKTEKPRSRMYRIPEIALSAEWNRCKRLVGDVAARLKSGDWSEVHPDEIPVLELPEWQVRKLEQACA
jgi:hypothetical protein